MESPWARFSPWTLSKQRCRLVKRCVALLPLVFPGSVALPLVRGIRQTPLGHFNSFVSHDVRSLADASSSFIRFVALSDWGGNWMLAAQSMQRKSC